MIEFYGAIGGAVANGIGYGVSLGLTFIKAQSIKSMSRSARKNYLTENIFKNSRSYANANLHTFMDDPIGIVSKSFLVFKSGFYSSLTSTIIGGAYDW